MARWSGNVVKLWFASAFVLGGCGVFGGQTGQGEVPSPGGAACTPTRAPANREVDGVSPAEFANEFVGRYTVQVRWHPSVAGGAPIPDEELTLVVTYQGADGMSCPLSVPVLVDITTRDSGIHDTGAASLTTDASGSALLEFAGPEVRLSARLQQSNGMVDVSGSLTSLVGNLAGDSAVFPPPPAPIGTGAGGTPGAP